MEKKRIAYCKWCGEEIGYEDQNGVRYLNRIFHMRMKHPVRKAVADFIYPITARFGGIMSFPIGWK